MMRLGKGTWIALGVVGGVAACAFAFLLLDRGSDDDDRDGGRARKPSAEHVLAERDDDDVSRKKLEQMERRLAELEAERARALANPPRPTPRPTRPTPDAKAIYAVSVAGDPVKGKPTALVTIVRAGEYACPYCEKVRPTLATLLDSYDGEVRLVDKDFIVHPQTATAAALAACAAHAQGKFWEMDELLWEKAFKTRQFDAAHLEALAKELRLDLPAYRAAVDGPCRGEIQEDQQQLAAVGVGATPGFFINGRFLSGAQPLASFKVVVDEELAKAQARVRAGADPARYYDEWVVAKGLTKLVPPPP